ncbi:hypothetical protein DNK47_02330 [Mycoplasma wenyonii]|uniref:Uncharacterized protein n=1 Tax=Mycoplasma wenyonii TaxID=65123 RepID=A0A328PPR6_9MOLU|nr:hypothetical protein [Mycoplasma wenyonii]RAO94958.1 hypothetical protein DNK47_02330 [Mycoplasma wenyonii]
MSWVLRGFALFAFSSGMSFSPQGAKHAVDWVKNLKLFTPPPVVVAGESMQQIMEEGNYEGCAELGRNIGRGSLWFICSKRENANRPSFFNYNRTRPSGTKAMQVISVTTTPKKEIKYATGKTEDFTFLSPWMYKLKGKSLSQMSDCSFTVDSQGSSPKSYTLKCHNETIQSKIHFEK